MNIYGLTPLDSCDASWRFSNEKEMVWACAPSAKRARELVADLTNIPVPAP